MKRIVGTLVVTASILAAIWIFVPPLLEPEIVEITAVSPVRKTVYDTVSCSGNIVSANIEHLSVGRPAQITAVYVSEGESVKAGELLMKFRPLDESQAVNGLSNIFYSELTSYFDNIYNDLNSSEILAAAEVFANTGELPDYFKDFYMPDTKVSVHDGNLYSTIDGTVTSLKCSVGDTVSGIFSSVIITDTENLAAKVLIPEQYLSKVEIGQKASITCKAQGSAVYVGRVTEIKPYARKIGGLLTNEEIVIECLVEIENAKSLMPGLEAKAKIFSVEYPTAVVIPFSAVDQDERGKEFVYKYVGGKLEKHYIKPVFENDDGIVVDAGFSEEDLLVDDPPGELCEGMAVTIAQAGQVK